MTFEAPALLLTLMALPVVLGLYVLAQRRHARHPVHFSNFALLSEVAKANNRWRRHVPAALMLVALGALLLGAARPHAQVQVPRGEATVVLVLDVSGSMRAEDVDPTRLAAAQEAARTFVEVLPEDFQVGVVAFSDAAEVLAQPTIDRGLIERALDSLVADGGTAIGDALVEALALDPGLERGERRAGARPLAAVVLLSDGYQTAGGVQPLEAAAQADRQGLPVFTVALGTPEGVVEVPGPNGFPQIQRVPPDPETLRGIADATDGEFFEAPTEDDLRSIYEDLGRRIGFVSERREVTAAFAAAGFVLAAVGVGLASIWSRRFP
jgi:Ca-activated chloride channel family protein